MEGVVPHVAVAVGVLQVLKVCNDRGSLEHSAKRGIVDAPVHMGKPDIVELFVAGVAATTAATGGVAPVEDEVAGSVIAAVGVAPLAEGVVGVAFGDRASLVSRGNQ